MRPRPRPGGGGSGGGGRFIQSIVMKEEGLIFFVPERCVFNDIMKEEEEDTRLTVGTPSSGETEKRACEWEGGYVLV
jgi:hypothetical protein